MRRAIREHHSALTIFTDSHGLTSEEMQAIQNLIFTHQQHQAALSFEFYTSAKGPDEITKHMKGITDLLKFRENSVKASAEAKAFVEKLTWELKRNYPEKFSRILTKEDWKKELAIVEEKIAALEANQLDEFPAIKSEEQRRQVLAGLKHIQQFLRTKLADKSSEES